MSITPARFAKYAYESFKNFLDDVAHSPLYTNGNDHGMWDLDDREYYYEDIVEQYDLNNNSDMLKAQFREVGEWLQAQKFALDKPQPIDLGTSALFYKIGNLGIRMQPDNICRLDHPLTLPSKYKTCEHYKETVSTIEIVPFVDISKNTWDDVEKLQQNAALMGLSYEDDTGLQQQGPYQHEGTDEIIQVLIDPDCYEITDYDMIERICVIPPEKYGLLFRKMKVDPR